MANIEKREYQNKIIYRVKVRLKGFPTQTASLTRLADAKKWATEVEDNLRKGRFFKSASTSDHTVADAIDRYIDTILIHKPKTYDTQLPQLKWWKGELGDYALNNITAPIIADARDKLAKGITPQGKLRSRSTVNRYMAALSHVFTITYKEWGWINENPFLKLNRFKESTGRVRFLSDSERDALLEECKKSHSSILYLVVVLALSTGARKNEILSLRWKDIDFKRKVIMLEETKNGERRILPLASLALELLQKRADEFQQKDNKDFFVFPKASNPIEHADIRGSFELAMTRAGIKDFRFHDLRHSAASYLAMNGASLAAIAEILGHKTLAMVKRYAHLSEAHTAKVVASMNKKIFGKPKK